MQSMRACGRSNPSSAMPPYSWEKEMEGRGGGAAQLTGGSSTSASLGMALKSATSTPLLVINWRQSMMEEALT